MNLTKIIAATLTTAGIGLGGLCWQEIIELNQLATQVTELQALNTTPQPSKELLRIQTAVYGEKEKRETLKEVYVATEQLQQCTIQLEQSLNSAELSSAEELKQRLKACRMAALTAQCALSNEEYTFKQRDTEARTRVITDLQNDHRVQICTSMLPEEVHTLLNKLPGTTKSAVAEDNLKNPLATYKLAALENLIGPPQYASLQQLQATLYTRGTMLAKERLPRDTPDADILAACCGLLMVDIVTSHLDETNIGFNLFVKTLYELLLADLAQQHHTAPTTENTAALYVLACRSLSRLPAKQLAHILYQSKGSIQNLDLVIQAEGNSMQEYEPFSKYFIQNSIRARRTLNDAFLQYHKLLRDLQEKAPEAFK